MSDNSQNEVLTEQLNDNNESLTDAELRHKLNAIIKEKNNMEIDFGLKRAKFKEIMLKQEDEMRMVKQETNKRIELLEDQLTNLQKELDESKSLLMVSQLQKENEVDYYKQKHNEDVNRIRLSLNNKLEAIKLQYEEEIENLKRLINEKQENDQQNLNNLKSQSIKNESMLSVVTKSFKQKVGSLNTSLNTSGHKLNNKQFLKEQDEEFDFILPLEEEAKMLKEKFRITDKKLNSYEKIFSILISEYGIDKICELINACSSSDENCETVSKLKEEFMNNNKNLESSIQLDDKESILANLLCEQAKLRNENERLLERINQLLNSNCVNNTNHLNSVRNKQNQPSLPSLDSSMNSSSKLRRTQSLTIYNKLNNSIHLNDKFNQRLKFDQTDSKIIKSTDQNDHIKIASKSCEMCYNYEIEVQTLQLNETDFLRKLENSEKLLNASKQELIKEQEFRLQREEKFIQQVKECDETIENLQTKLSTANYEISELKRTFNDSRKCLNDKLEDLKKINKQLHSDLINIQNENARLLGLFVERSKQLDSKIIDLPQNLDELQIYCLKIREDLISVSISKEKLEEEYKSQLMLIKEQQKSEQQSERRIGESLNSENERLKAQLSSALKELNNLKQVHNEHELLLKQSSSSMQTYEKQINELQNITTELMTKKVQLEQENSDLRSKVQNLQADIETSEAVQKDFVQLSQSLQIELEKIRQGDIEVRWQHEDDVSNCNGCKKFISKKEKQHCSHCGKIFCGNCNSKTVKGGPYHTREFKVCAICHTLLDQTTAPYFSTSAPQNPTM